MNRGWLVRVLGGLMVALAALMMTTLAHGRGSVRVAKSTVNEDDGTWRLKLTMNYGSMPHLAHVPMILSFKQTTLYERYLDDSTGDTPATRRVPVRNATSIDLPMDVGFADMSGKMFKITKFKFKLTREVGFEAGEYTMKVRLASGGALGRPVRLKLNGNNKAINRKSLAFGSPPAKKKSKSSEPAASEMPEPSGPMAAEDVGLDLSDIPDISDEEEARLTAEAPPSEKPKQGGCGCGVVGEPGPGQLGLWVLSAMMLGLVLLRRRR